ncbi:MAG: hypothetical protein ACRC20_12670 [Segniliparus sp.]|uniref:hypothetical protein n=1 Tax=Segniliparus sp. TaxID=2804064 RepID=UPI003F415F0E
MAFPQPHGHVADRVVGFRWPSIDETAWGADAGADLRAAQDDRASAAELRGHAREFGQSAEGEAFDAHRHALEAHAKAIEHEAEAKDRSAAVRNAVSSDTASAKESIDRIVRVTELQIQAHEALCRALRADPAPGREQLLQQGSGAVDLVVQDLRAKIAGHAAERLAADRPTGKGGSQAGAVAGAGGAVDGLGAAQEQGGAGRGQEGGDHGQEDRKQQGRAPGFGGLAGVVDAVARTSRPLAQEAGESAAHGDATAATGGFSSPGSLFGFAAGAAGGLEAADFSGGPAHGPDGAAGVAAGAFGGAAYGPGGSGARPSSNAEQERRGGKKGHGQDAEPAVGSVHAETPLAPTVSGSLEAAAQKPLPAAAPTIAAGSQPLFVPEAAERPAGSQGAERGTDQSASIPGSAVVAQPNKGAAGGRPVVSRHVDWKSTGAAQAFRESVGSQAASPQVLGPAGPDVSKAEEPDSTP